MPTDDEIARRLAFVHLDDDDRKALVTLGPALRPALPRIVDSFFAALSALPEAAGLFADRALLDSAYAQKLAHLRSMTRGVYGGAYAEERLELAALYAAAGVEPAVLIGAFEVLLRELGGALRAAFPGDGLQLLTPLRKLILFDIGLMVDTLVAAREATIRAQAAAIQELSTPVLRIRDRLVVLPIIGAVDGARAAQVTEALLAAVRGHRAKVAIVDVTGSAGVDSSFADHLLKAARAVRLMGAHVVLCGIAPTVAQALIALGVALDDGIITVADLHAAVELAAVLEQGAPHV